MFEICLQKISYTARKAKKVSPVLRNKLASSIEQNKPCDCLLCCCQNCYEDGCEIVLFGGFNHGHCCGGAQNVSIPPIASDLPVAPAGA
jgi:hypothetical protein